MGILLPIVAIVAGILAAASVVLEKIPNLKDFVEKIQKYQAVIGVVAIFMAISPLLNWAKVTKTMSFVPWISLIACMVSCALIGFLLGYPVLQGLFIDDLSEENRKKADDLRQKLAPYKILGGLVSIGTGVVLFLSYMAS